VVSKLVCVVVMLKVIPSKRSIDSLLLKRALIVIDRDNFKILLLYIFLV